MFLACPFLSYSQNKKFDKLIKKYDVSLYVKNITERNPALFWEAVVSNNEGFWDYSKAIKKKKRTALDATDVVVKSLGMTQLYRSTLPVVDSLQFIADTLINNLGICALYENAQMRIVYDDEKNAATYPDGFIYVYTPVIFDLTSEQTLGVCAHEAAHLLLYHVFLNAYAEQKKLKRNNTIASIVASANAFTQAFEHARGTENSTQKENSDIVERLFDAAEKDAKKYRYKYSREEEIEADIIAYRFLEFMGIDGRNYINALKELGYDDYEYSDDEDTHPTVKFRVDLLEYLSNRVD